MAGQCSSSPLDRLLPLRLPRCRLYCAAPLTFVDQPDRISASLSPQIELKDRGLSFKYSCEPRAYLAVLVSGIAEAQTHVPPNPLGALNWTVTLIHNDDSIKTLHHRALFKANLYSAAI